MSELEVIEAVTSSYPPWVQTVFVTSNIKTIQDALSVLTKLEAIKGQQHNPQRWSNHNRPQAHSSYGREDHRDGRTHAVRQTYASREQSRTRNFRYPEHEGYDKQESLDLLSAFLQIPLEASSRKYTAFLFHTNVYQFHQVPFGTKNLLAAFVRGLRKVLGSDMSSFCACYVDGIVIFSKTSEEHLRHIN
jgi:hypothetical protein